MYKFSGAEGAINYFDAVINSFISKRFIMDEFTNKITTRQRPSIINNDKIIPSYGQLLHMVINQESSDDESFEDIDSEISYSEPSLRQVCEYLFDNKTLMTINVNYEKYFTYKIKLNLQEFPEYVNPGVLLKNIDHDMQAIDLKNYLTKKCG